MKGIYKHTNYDYLNTTDFCITNTDLVGNDIFRSEYVMVKDRDSCKNKCKNNIKCMGFVISKVKTDEFQCWNKGFIEPYLQNSEGRCYGQIRDPPVPEPVNLINQP
eukprot:UN04416